MIVFDLRCGADHIFEAWFASSDDYDCQRGRGLVVCPICDNTSIGKAAMAPAIPTKSNRDDGAATLLAAQRRMEANATYVGRDFAARARALHAATAAGGGEATPRADAAAAASGDAANEADGAIYGEASLADAAALVDDGIPILPLPFRPRVRFDA